MSAADMEVGVVRRLPALKPGDTLVVSFPGSIQRGVMDDLADKVRELLGLDESIAIMVIDMGAQFTVMEGP